MTPARRIGIVTVATLAALVLAAFVVPTAHAGLPRDAGIQLVAPAHDAVVYESGLRFAWQPAPGTARHFLLVSRTPFETRGATRLPADDGLRVVPLSHPIASLEDAGLTISGDQPVYWAAAGTSADGRRTWMSDVRRVVVLGRFMNRVEPSPLVSVSPILSAHPVEHVGPDRIHLSAGYEIDPTRGEPVLPAALREAAGPTMGKRTYIVYFADGDPEATRKTVLEAGGSIVSYLPDRAFLVRMESSGQLSLDTEGAWVGAFQPAYKLSSRLSPDPVALETATLLLFPDGDLNAVGTQVQRLGATELVRSNNGINRLMRVRATRGVLDALAQHPDVEWIEPYVQPTMDNVNVQWVVQTWSQDNRRVWDLGIRGAGQVICTTDAGIDVSHNMFRDVAVPIPGFGDYPTHRKIIAYKNGSPDPNVTFGDHGVYHGTHTAGTAAGSDSTIGTDVRDGVAKDAKLYFMDLSGPALANAVAPPADLNDLYQPSYTGNAGGAARISSNSWGSTVMGDYDLNAQQVDQFMWNHPDYLLCFSNGNSSGFMTVGSPATAKNSVGVGGTRNGTNANFIYTGTSRGPTEDGRRKPTVCTPGQGVISAFVGPNSFQSLTGTSMASPGCAGAAALIRQYLTEGWYPTGAKVPANGFAPSAALLKAMLINSGSNTVSGGLVPDQNIGYGRVTVDSVLYFAGDTRRLLLVDYPQGLTSGQAIEYVVNVTNTAIPLKVSLCWTDYPGNPVVTSQIVNNLDLTVTNGTLTYRGNVMTNGVSQTGGSADLLNVEEETQISVPSAGLWRIRIDAPSVPIGPQPFGLCVTGGIGNDAGVLALDRASYGSGSTVGLRVTDTNAGGSVTVSVSSPSESAGESVILTGSNGVYTGSIPLSPFSGASGDGTLHVSNGDVITATYLDGAPPATLTAQAQVDFVPPTITAVSALNSGAGNVTVSWTTNGSANSRVYYGASPALGSSVPLDPAFVTSHALVISGLTPGQTYYYDVESQDLNGNVTRDDNGTQHYRITVNRLSEILLVYADPAFPKNDRYASALNALGWTYDVWQGSLANSPPLGDLTSGLRAYKAVWWESYDQYPPFEDGARTTLTQYLDGGGRLVAAGHDIAWALGDVSTPSPYYTPERAAWLQSTLHTNFLADPSGWAGVIGVPGDPISNDYTISVPYTEHRAGGSGDEVSSSPGAGTASYDWISDEATPDNCGFRWESSGPLGTPGTAVWAGTPSRIATMYFEWPDVDPGHAPVSATRTGIMDKTLNWLIGRTKPSVAVVAPNGGEVLVSNSTSISWTESTAGGTSVGARTIEYSIDDGQSWVTLTTSAGASPYTWDLTAVPNAPSARVRVRVADNGTPALAGIDGSDAVFAIARPGGDGIGPAVVAGSIFASPNPINNQAPANLTATLTDAAAGNSNITAAEWSFGDLAAPPGLGHAMSGTFGSPTVSVNAALTTATFAPGTHALWVRGRDAAGNWGQVGRLTVVVNGSSVSVGDQQFEFALKANAPNPVSTTTTIAYALPQRGNVDLAIYDVTGRRIRTLVQGDVPAGLHQVEWDRSTGDGRLVQPGVYYYRLAVAGHRFERRMVTLN
jgi:Subtilase family/FlgD Ig-like domain